MARPFRQPKTIVMLNDDAGCETNVTIANVCRTSGQTGCVEPPSEFYVCRHETEPWLRSERGLGCS
jgi:hypothetical protein